MVFFGILDDLVIWVYVFIGWIRVKERLFFLEELKFEFILSYFTFVVCLLY